MPIVIKQFYLVVLSIVLSYWFTTFPEWTTWVLLVALAVYDLVAVLAPGGPLNLLGDLVRRRGDEIPALFYESRPAVHANAPYFPFQ
jgi:presenilin 1